MLGKRVDVISRPARHAVANADRALARRTEHLGKVSHHARLAAPLAARLDRAVGAVGPLLDEAARARVREELPLHKRSVVGEKCRLWALDLAQLVADRAASLEDGRVFALRALARELNVPLPPRVSRAHAEAVAPALPSLAVGFWAHREHLPFARVDRNWHELVGHVARSHVDPPAAASFGACAGSGAADAAAIIVGAR